MSIAVCFPSGAEAAFLLGAFANPHTVSGDDWICFPVTVEDTPLDIVVTPTFDAVSNYADSRRPGSLITFTLTSTKDSSVMAGDLVVVSGASTPARARLVSAICHLQKTWADRHSEHRKKYGIGPMIHMGNGNQLTSHTVNQTSDHGVSVLQIGGNGSEAISRSQIDPDTANLIDAWTSVFIQELTMQLDGCDQG